MRRLSVTLIFALTACATASGARDDAERGVTFIEDDYPAALKLARERNVPLFVDAWAPWCHSCVFLREHVLRSPQLQRADKRFVFLAIDTEREQSAAFLEKYPVDNWPTLFIVDPQREQAVLKWLGTATVEQLEKLLDDGERAARASGPAQDPLTLLAEADRLYAERKDATAAYRAALAALPQDHPRRARAVESLINSLYGRDPQQCATAGAELAPALPRGPSFVNAVVLSLSCASSAPVGAPWRAGAIATLEPLAEEALGLPGILADDLSGIFELLVDLRSERRDQDGAQQLALRWLSFLEAEAAKAPSPAARAVFDPHRVGAAVAAKQPLRAEAALLQSEKDLPHDYNPPARLGIIYREAGRLDDALAAINRAFPKAYGPRKLRLYEIKSSIYARKSDVAAQRATLEEAVSYGKALPAAQRPEKTVAWLEQQAAKLKSP
ncbi:MAG: thioredoxin family protein [Archangiaceae bacterium]|nr:thioredoxin family protein [Archangiaceae bacterium]